MRKKRVWEIGKIDLSKVSTPAERASRSNRDLEDRQRVNDELRRTLRQVFGNERYWED